MRLLVLQSFEFYFLTWSEILPVQNFSAVQNSKKFFEVLKLVHVRHNGFQIFLV